MTTKGKLNRKIVVPEGAPGSTKELEKGHVVYQYRGHTYGLIPSGVHVAEQESEPPFWDIPKSAVDWE